MTNEIKKTGGARIGFANATWPFAQLRVNRNRLELKASIIGKLVFAPADIESIEPYGVIPLVGKGIKINHRVKNYDSKIVFWTFENPASLIREIEKIGFFDNSDLLSQTLQQHISETRAASGFPVKTGIVVILLVVWNLLLLFDLVIFFNSKLDVPPLGIGAASAISLILVTAVSLLISESARKLIIREGHSIDDIRKFIYFLILFCVFFLLVILASPGS